MRARVGIILSLVLLLGGLGGCDGYTPPVTEYQQGRNDGVRATREAHKEYGALGAGAVRVATEVGPANSKKSADWNAGFRAGVRQETSK